MKIERLERPEPLWRWLQANMRSPGLVLKAISAGYGKRFCVYQAGYRRLLMERMFENTGDAVAQVSGATLQLFHPQYFSDFEALLRRFEADTGIESRLQYWEGPDHGSSHE